MAHVSTLIRPAGTSFRVVLKRFYVFFSSLLQLIQFLSKYALFFRRKSFEFLKQGRNKSFPAQKTNTKLFCLCRVGGLKISYLCKISMYLLQHGRKDKESTRTISAYGPPTTAGFSYFYLDRKSTRLN